MTLAPRAVVVHRRSELDLLVERHGTRGQAEFFLQQRGRDLGDSQARHDALQEALHQVDAAVPATWRRAAVERADLPRLRFDPEDVVLAVGADGLVANVAKYVTDQPVVGVDPEPGTNPGVLVRHRTVGLGDVLARVASGSATFEHRCTVEARLDDGQRLRALNEVFVGDVGHQSARYRLLGGPDAGERQSSSGLVVSTGTGATGWCASLSLDRRHAPAVTDPADPRLAWFVREAWPSPATGRTRTEGVVAEGESLELVAESDLVVFGDGVESDRLLATWGQRVVVRLATQRLHLVVP